MPALKGDISTRSKEFLLMLEIFDMIRDPNRTYTLREIAAATGVRHGTLHWIEQQALGKLRKALEKRGISEAFNLAENRLREGTVDLVTVLQTQQTLFQAEDALVQARLAHVQAIVSLYQALGGGWSPKPVEAANAR